MEGNRNLLKRTFVDVYGTGYSTSNFTGPEYTQSITTNAQNVYVHDCVFRDCSSTTEGGALSCGTSVNRLLVEQTSFISCKTSSSKGGAIYFYSTSNGQCVLSKICSFGCNLSYSGYNLGMCAYIYATSNNNYKNHVNDSSVIHSLTKNIDTLFALDIYFGNVLCPSVNLSNNQCNRYPALRCYITGSSGSDTCCISYSSFVNNTADGSSGWGCVYIRNSISTASQSIVACNLINNKIASPANGIIDSGANLFIRNSCILGNAIGKTIFYTNSGSITLINCTIDDDIFTNGRYIGSVTVSKTIQSTFINALSHIATRKCDSYFDSYGSLTVKLNAPTGSCRYLISCNIRRPLIDPLRFMEFIFLLTMLPSDPSNDYYFDSNCYLHTVFAKN
jgi:hypothetical protein